MLEIHFAASRRNLTPIEQRRLPMQPLTHALAAAGLLALASAAEANTVQFSGTINKLANGTTFDTWLFTILAPASFTLDVLAYEASQSNTATAGYFASDINGDGELTWLDADTYFYRNTGQPLAAADALVRCDDVANNCPVYQNGLNAGTSPVRVTTRQQAKASQDGSIHFRRDPWFEVSADAGSYRFLVADFRLDPGEAAGGINANDSFSPPTNFAGPITGHADYRVTLSSATVNFSISGNTVTVSPVPVPATIWLFGGALAGLGAWGRRGSKG
jgi:hypothetical protein